MPYKLVHGRSESIGRSELPSSLPVGGKQGRPSLCKAPIEVVEEASTARIIVDEPVHPLKSKLLEQRVVRHCGIGADQLDTIEDGDDDRVSQPVPVAAMRGGEPLYEVLPRPSALPLILAHLSAT